MTAAVATTPAPPAMARIFKISEMYKKDKSISDWLALFLTISLILAGGVLLSIGYLEWRPVPLSDTVVAFCKKVGEFIFVAGAFAAFLKTIQIMGVVRDDLANVLYSDKFISEYLDVKKLWVRIYRIVHKGLYPNLPEHISLEIINKNLPRDISYFIEDLTLNIQISWKDRENGVIWINTVQQQKIKPTRAGSMLVERNFVGAKATYELISVKANKKDITESVQISQGTPNDTYIAKVSFSVDGDSELEYVVRISQDVNTDPSYHLEILRIVNNIEVNVLLMMDDLEFSFVPYGEERWTSSTAAFLQAQSFTASVGGIYGEHQGFFLLFKARDH